VRVVSDDRKEWLFDAKFSPVAGSSAEARPALRARVLPAGELFDVVELGWKGEYTKLDLTGHKVKLDAPLEIQSESKIYLGELYDRIGTVAYVRIRHSLTRGVRY
jgi:hypothetical protein